MNLPTFNFLYIVILWVIVLSGLVSIYISPCNSTVIFWFSLFTIWLYLYRPLVNKFFYTKMMDELTFKLGKLDDALKRLD